MGSPQAGIVGVGGWGGVGDGDGGDGEGAVVGADYVRREICGADEGLVRENEATVIQSVVWFPDQEGWWECRGNWVWE